jgi:UDP-N-acetylmuramoyl-tripeptide--D-alanyl-D-alanine ligase
MKKILQLKLKLLAKLILKKYKPKVIGITGSVGKTSAKEAIFSVLSVSYKTRRNIKNYNNEIGLPLTIIGVESPGRSFIGWLIVFLKAIKLLIINEKKYPEMLVLEMGVDRPGDMEYLLSIVKCDIGIMTTIGTSHLEFFGTVENIEKEKTLLLNSLKPGGWSVLNNDDERIRKIAKNLKSKNITYGFSEKSNVRAIEISFSFEKNKSLENLIGLSFKLGYNGSYVPVLVPGVISETSIYSCLIAACVGVIYDINLLKISEALRSLKLPSSRMNLIKGIKKTLIIDDSYNSSPQSAKAALEVLSKISISKENKKIAILGDMLELGNISEKSHFEIGNLLFELGINQLYAIGSRARDIAQGARSAGMKDGDIFEFADSEEAGKFIQQKITKGDLLLVKGSQGVRTEKIVKELMADPLRASELICRQDESWK